MKKKIVSVLLALAMSATALAGCGGGQGRQTNDAGQEVIPDKVEEEPKAETTGTAAAPADAAQEIIYSLYSEPDGIDPNITNNSFASVFLSNLFEGLVTYDSTGSVVNGIADSYDVSDDGLVYTFHLKDGLKWSDGSDLTADDFVYSMKRVLDPATAAMYVDIVNEYILNAREYYEGNATEEELGIKALDAKTVEYTLINPTVYFIDLLTMWVFYPVQAATIEANGDKWSTSPDTYVCNGPFKISEMNMGESVVLVPNENYWDKDAVKLEKITLRYIKDNATALTAYESDEIDGMNTVPASDYARLKAEGAGVRTVGSYATTYYDINCKKAPFDNPLVRKALNLAIDRTSIINNVIQTDATPAFSLLAPGYAVDGKDITEGRGDYGLSATADVEGAKAALAEAGYPDGEGFPVLHLSYYSNDTVKMTVEALAQMWEENLGIKVEISSADWAVYYDDILSGNYEVGAMGWSADYIHPMSFMPLLYTDDANNHTGYSNPEYDKYVKEAQTATDAKTCAEAVMKAEKAVSEDYPLLYLFYRSNNYMMKDRVKGAYMATNSNLYFKDAYVE